MLGVRGPSSISSCVGHKMWLLISEVPQRISRSIGALRHGLQLKGVDRAGMHNVQFAVHP